MEKSSIFPNRIKTLANMPTFQSRINVQGAATILSFVLFVGAGAGGIWYFYTGDDRAPEVAVTNLVNEQLVLAGPIELRGVATYGEIKAIMVKVDNDPPTSVIPNAKNDFSDWSIVLPMSTPGTHTIEVEVIDHFDNIGLTKLSVLVKDPASIMYVPDDQLVEASEITGAVVSYHNPIIGDDLELVSGPVCSPASGSLFPLGRTTVSCTATMFGENTIKSEFSITVFDTVAPTITPPPDIVAKNSGESQMQISLGSPTVKDAADPKPVISNNAPAGGFSVGTTTVLWRASDDSGNTATAIQKVTVVGDADEGRQSITYSRGGGGGGSSRSNDDTDNSNGGNNESPDPKFTITINSVDMSGNLITGLKATVSEDGQTVKTGQTPLEFTGNSRYRVTVSENDNLEFDHWEDGSTSATRRITLDQGMTITAYFASIAAPTGLSVQITNPTQDSTIVARENQITIGGKASQGSTNIEVVEVRVDEEEYVAAIPVKQGDWSSWSVTLDVAAGQHRLVPRVTDIQGNQAWNSIYVTITVPNDDGDTPDKFGIEKVYPTANGGNEWYVNMNDPDSDPLFRNLPSMTKQSDGSWQVSGGDRGQVRMEAWSPSNEKWLNVEITMYAKIVDGSNELLQLYSRGGHHTSSNECLGSAYKARFYGDGDAAWVKEVTHPAYAGNRGAVEATDVPLADRWIGLKAVIYNFVENGKTYVRMESYIDDDVTGSNGNLVINNNWKLASVYEDEGGWSTDNSDFNGACSPMNKDSSQENRQRDEILNLPGGTSSQNIAAFRSDDLTWNWKYLSVREIQVP